MLHKWVLMLMTVLSSRKERGCRLNAKIDFREPQPVFIHHGTLLEPTDAAGNIFMAQGDSITISCDHFITHPHTINLRTIATVTCEAGDTFRNDAWLSTPGQFSLFRCSSPPNHMSQRTNRTCYDGNVIYEVGYKVQNNFYPLYESCFNERELYPLYSKYTQKPYNYNFQTRVKRPIFKDDGVYSREFDVPVDWLLSPKEQRRRVSELVGRAVDRYIVPGLQELSRGHLAAKTDFVFAFGERATFHYVNCAPQWTGFNAGNWNTLEVDLRRHIHESNYSTIIYTGTFGVSQLLSDAGDLVYLYLYKDSNNNPVIPVPLYFYKVVYEPKLKKGIAFVGINNPYLTIGEAKKIFFCQDQCHGSYNVSWLSWHPDSSREGYTFCCTVEDFRKTVPYLPPFKVTGLLL
ncbi:unnamed protein product [Plutella xylostella]|uniref:(diamondback moth) hypothetical protein n=1 Tax=Plutella xylostella TaxID=51655 RepID=A0A8S4FNJ0_PLUXY|nr:unnamed protein product [Plutella xylostella]